MSDVNFIKVDPNFGRDFAWTPDNSKTVAVHIAKYPAGRHSAVMPLLDLAQRQVGEQTNTQGWLPVPVIEFVARQLDMPYMRVYEVASFYTMYNLQPVGKFHVQLCGTTPCMLRGSDDVMRACKDRGLAKGRTTLDGLFTLTEVECLGACANAPMVQINDDNFEDLTYDSMYAILKALTEGLPIKEGDQFQTVSGEEFRKLYHAVKTGPQIDRKTSCPVDGPTTLKEMVTANHDYREAL